MNILLINSNMLIPPITPLGLAYVAAAVREAGHNVKLVDLNFSVNYKSDISNAVSEYQPDVIGISIRNIDNVTMIHSVYFLPKIKEIIAFCQDISVAPIVLGGPGFSMMPEEIMLETHADYGVIGEGEKAFINLLACIHKREKPKGLPGIIFSDEEQLVKLAPKNMSSAQLNQLSIPARDLFDNARYLHDGGMGNIQTKRGCNQQCIYCTYPVIEGKKLRFRSPEKVVNEIEILMQMGIDYLHFSDSTFNNPHEYAYAICDEMIKRKVFIQYTPYMSPSSPSKELFRLLKQTGCDGITFGVDTLSEKIVHSLKKGFKIEEVYQAALYCREFEIPFSLNLLFGGPGETKETAMESLSNIEKIKPVAAGAMVGIRCYPHTRLWKIACKERLIAKDTNLLEPFYYVSPSIDKDWLVETIKEYNEQHDNFFIPTSAKGLHTDDLVVQLFRDGFRGPFWKVANELKKRLATLRVLKSTPA
ncbi:MAG: lipid biosynthesis B12-binding/radical SAM protein [Candidatus Electrothrix scaldis]|nr:MAG: lipid biosynthesis B12-binding/radical SAM protein [Candidatus Electrothrix sp. GW3-3]